MTSPSETGRSYFRELPPQVITKVEINPTVQPNSTDPLATIFSTQGVFDRQRFEQFIRGRAQRFGMLDFDGLQLHHALTGWQAPSEGRAVMVMRLAHTPDPTTGVVYARITEKGAGATPVTLQVLSAHTTPHDVLDEHDPNLGDKLKRYLGYPVGILGEVQATVEKTVSDARRQAGGRVACWVADVTLDTDGLRSFLASEQAKTPTPYDGVYFLDASIKTYHTGGPHKLVRSTNPRWPDLEIAVARNITNGHNKPETQLREVFGAMVIEIQNRGGYQAFLDYYGISIDDDRYPNALMNAIELAAYHPEQLRTDRMAASILDELEVHFVGWNAGVDRVVSEKKFGGQMKPFRFVEAQDFSMGGISNDALADQVGTVDMLGQMGEAKFTEWFFDSAREVVKRHFPVYERAFFRAASGTNQDRHLIILRKGFEAGKRHAEAYYQQHPPQP